METGDREAGGAVPSRRRARVPRRVVQRRWFIQFRNAMRFMRESGTKEGAGRAHENCFGVRSTLTHAAHIPRPATRRARYDCCYATAPEDPARRRGA